MRTCQIGLIVAGCVLATFALNPPEVRGQVPPRKPAAGRSGEGPRTGRDRNRSTTILSVELLTGDEGTGARAQRWVPVFEKLGITLAIRRQTTEDKVGVTEEKTTETVRHVKVVGKLDTRGRLIFDDRIYTEADSEKLGQWFKELREFGHQGTPEKQPLWGLTKQQFGTIHVALCQPLAEDPKDRSLAEIIQSVRLPESLPLRVNDSAAKRIRELGDARGGQSVGELSQGTALAAILLEHGLGYRPRRLPSGEIELSIVVAAEEKGIWPVGWVGDKPAAALAPKLFSFTQVELEDIELDAVLEAASGVIGVPILTDRAALAKKEIDFASMKISHPAKRTTWGLALKALLGQAKTKSELLIDETGRPFLWITPLDTPRRARPD